MKRDHVAGSTITKLRVLKVSFERGSGAVGQGERLDSCCLNTFTEDAGYLVLAYGSLKLGDRESGWSTAPHGGDVGSGHVAVGLDEPIGEDIELWTTQMR